MLRPFADVLRFGGRMRRTDFWPYMLSLAFLYIVLLASFMALPGLFERRMDTMFLFVALLVLLAYAAVVRRMHDVGWGAIWMTAYVVLAFSLVALSLGLRAAPVEGALDPTSAAAPQTMIAISLNAASAVMGLLIFMVCLMPGAPDDNEYGADPRALD